MHLSEFFTLMIFNLGFTRPLFTPMDLQKIPGLQDSVATWEKVFPPKPYALEMSATAFRDEIKPSVEKELKIIE
ncbi:hypothetical protein GNI_133040 [Gregarina niphandrodes]|uniref:Uncharacterized protein n=1 Tax=Gregarina niphandrodes TaxID=110365 RepID=A0A023B142_GRENI|nr:hypothetical protein GNI_133040 [Gregarina niphandrodes]EZG46736.1 hypothetical protein GNI_133040 [Gregarina niphandrodes]|eukprot:XP_011132245.1 hypothetical protein GNI_133040 [Gregarina niphandrodes]